MSPVKPKSPHKYNMGLFGNCQIMGYVDDRGYVQFLSWPQFDSPPLFGALHDKKLGTYGIVPAEDNWDSQIYYLDKTNMLVTEYSGSWGSYKVTDFASRFRVDGITQAPATFIRKVEKLSGQPKIKLDLKASADWGRKTVPMSFGNGHYLLENLEVPTYFYCSSDVGPFVTGDSLELDEPLYFVITTDPNAPKDAEGLESHYQKTKEYWHLWCGRSDIGNFHPETVLRSSLILKLHQFDKTGAIIASGMTSMPEHFGSNRNWDYRYCWPRDAFYTVQALQTINHHHELQRYCGYLLSLIKKKPERIQPLFSIDGETELSEVELDLEGYLSHPPVRVGNLAAEQIQNDIYGQILMTFSLLEAESDKHLPWESISYLIDCIDKYLDDPDAGLWEFRGTAQIHCYSSLFHWLGALYAEDLCHHHNRIDLIPRLQEMQKRAKAWVERCYVEEGGYYAQAVDSREFDGSLLKLITSGYLNPKNEKSLTHLKAVQENLGTDHGLFYRYRHVDDFGEPETAFLICAFWHVEALACLGQIDQAITIFENLLKCSNSLGIFSEDADPNDFSQWGNFPQTYTHASLIHAALKISQAMNA